jgi:hypothetical protein
MKAIWTRSGSLFAILFFVCCGSPVGTNATRVDAGRERHSVRLANGMLLVVAPSNSDAQASVVLAVRCGWYDEPPGKAEVAHLIEHLLIASTSPYVTALPAAGVTAAGSTEYDATFLYFTGPAESVPSMVNAHIRIISDRRNFTANEVSQQQTRVWQELRQRYGDAIGKTEGDAVDAAMFQSRDQRHLSGNLEELQALTPADADAFAAACYRPENSVLVVSGPVTLEQVMRYVDMVSVPNSAVRDTRTSRRTTETPVASVQAGERIATWSGTEFGAVVALVSADRGPASWFLDSVIMEAIQSAAARLQVGGTGEPLRCSQDVRRGNSVVVCGTTAHDADYLERAISGVERAILAIPSPEAQVEAVAAWKRVVSGRIAFRRNPVELADHCARDTVATGVAPGWCTGEAWPPVTEVQLIASLRERLRKTKRIVVRLRPAKEHSE